MLAGLLLALVLWPGDLAKGEEAKRLAITVQQGRLSVDLKDAEVREVLAQVGKEAGVTIVFGAASPKRISARFSDLELELGLRRLLGLASLNHVIVYSQESGGAVGIREVRVLDTALGGSEHAGRRVGAPLAQAQPASPPPPTVEESEGARRVREALERPQPQTSPPSGQESEPAQRFREALERPQERTLPTIGGPARSEQQRVPAIGGESEGTQRLQEALEQPRQQTPVPAVGGENEGARRFREALERARQQPPADESEATRRFREALERARQHGN